MKKIMLAALCSMLLVGDAFADSNGTVGGIINSETMSLGPGPFAHANAVGDPGNSIASATFVGGFTANQIQITGNLTEVIPSTWQTEADIVVTAPDTTTTTWQNAAVQTYTGPIAYDQTSTLGAPTAAAGIWSFEFIDTFDDGVGPDQNSSDVSVTLQESAPNTDANGVFALPGLSGAGTSDGSVGEFTLGGLFDTYAFTVTDPFALFSANTFADPTGVFGADADTEIALYNSAGVLLGNNDDIDFPNNTFSGLDDILVTAGDYTLYVSTFNTVFDPLDPSANTYGDGTGDYALTASLRMIPEPGSIAVLAMVGMVGLIRRRR